MQTEWVHWNPGASQPLRVSLEVECNTPTERILDNIRRNSENRTGWQKLEEPHSRVAILCGSGPSLTDTLEEIRGLQGDVFALNGAASFLDRNGVLPDYQVIMDARPETADLIGPAKKHLFASQVDPSCFERIPHAKLWHATHGEIAPEFPEYEDDYCMVGGVVSVGNAAVVLAYIMGYRTIHCFGFDSSHRDDQGHAFHQPLNAGDPTTVVEFGGREYIASFTMRLQAQYFMERLPSLEQIGCKIEVHGSGLLPDMVRARPKTEQDKYRAMWKQSDYRTVAPGELVADRFVEVAGITDKSDVIDFGCGTGRGAKRIRDLTGARVTMCDFADNCLDPEVKLPFVVADLTKPIHLEAEVGYCTDVMEHIPPEDVDAVLNNILACCPKTFFQISLVPDSMGALIGAPLHLSVHPYEWWLDKFNAMGHVLWSEDCGSTALYYVSNSLRT